MIPPLTEQEFEDLLPAWAKALARVKQNKCPLVVGLPVYNVLYGPKYGNERGIVVEFRPCNDACTIRRDHPACGHVVVECNGGCVSAGLADYWVPDWETERGRRQIELWAESTGRSAEALCGQADDGPPP